MNKNKLLKKLGFFCEENLYFWFIYRFSWGADEDGTAEQCRANTSKPHSAGYNLKHRQTFLK